MGQVLHGSAKTTHAIRGELDTRINPVKVGEFMIH